MDQYVRSGAFVQEHTLAYSAFAGHLAIVGEIACLGELVITVEKYLELVDGDDSSDALHGRGQDARVQTVLYNYNVHLRGHDTVLRWDNTHPHPGHADFHHLHVREQWRGGREQVEWIGEDRWPTLAEVIDAAEAWYHRNRGDLANPEGVPWIEAHVPRLASLLGLV